MWQISTGEKRASSLMRPSGAAQGVRAGPQQRGGRLPDPPQAPGWQGPARAPSWACSPAMGGGKGCGWEAQALP